LLTLLVGGSVALTVSAEFRATFLGWVITEYPEFSAIGTEEYMPFPDDEPEGERPTLDRTREESIREYARYAPSYIPEGYALSSAHYSMGYCSREYVGANEELDINVAVEEQEGNHMYNTEDSELTTITLFGEDAFIWERLGSTFVVFTFDGRRCHVIAYHLDMDTAIKVAQSMQKYDSMEQADADKPKTAEFAKLENTMPGYVPDFLSIDMIDIGGENLSLVYHDIFNNDASVTASPIPGESAQPPSEIFPLRGSMGVYFTWDYGGYRYLVDGGIDDREMQKMAWSMIQLTPAEQAENAQLIPLYGQLVEKGKQVINWYTGDVSNGNEAGLDVNMDHAENSYAEVGKFSTIAELKAATEEVFTREFCEAVLYADAFGEENGPPLYKEIDGALCRNTERVDSEWMYLPTGEADILQRAGDTVMLDAEQVDVESGEPFWIDLAMIKEDGAWKLNRF
jgi:hypothetical protein